MGVKKEMVRGENLAKKVKMTLFERCLEARDIFGISFDYSVYFDKATFERRFGNIMGVSDTALDKFRILM
jgi:hypothetical protein